MKTKILSALAIVSAAIALHVSPAQAASLNPGLTSGITQRDVINVQHHRGRKMRNCRVSHGRLICGGGRHDGDRHRSRGHGDRRGDGHGDRRSRH